VPYRSWLNRVSVLLKIECDLGARSQRIFLHEKSDAKFVQEIELHYRNMEDFTIEFSMCRKTW